ncbi:MAG: oxidoreductase [Rhodobacteraceae bacterium]|nr:oxidoreductase [Paracoccaceae bacterium]
MAHPAVRDLSDVDTGETLAADVLIIGGGPAGLSVARGLEGSGRDVLILESGGLAQDRRAEELNAVRTDPGNWTDAQQARRRQYHGDQTDLWSHDRQGYGVRCRLLGGSTQSWAGKSAAFDAIDYEQRDWVPLSGWPISGDDLAEPLDRAARALNLGPNCYDDGLWDRLRRDPPLPRPDPDRLGSFFWQFARSTLQPMEVMQTGQEFLNAPPANARILTGATVLRLLCQPDGRAVRAVQVVDRAGRRRDIGARNVVLAASAIENARLLLVSRDVHDRGIGNRHDTVGRYLMDHPCAVVARFQPHDIARMSRHYGFFGLPTGHGAAMYMRGLAPSAKVQREEGLLNCAAFMPGERAADDPLPAAKRLLTRQSQDYWGDLRAVLRSPGMVAGGVGRMAAQSPLVPKALTRFAVDQVVRFRPGFAAEEYLTGGMPHKLVGLDIQAVCEQVPEARNRVALGPETDRHGQPLPLVRWQVGAAETRTLARFGTLIAEEFARAGLPVPELERWIREEEAPDVIDMAHSAGTTRMSNDPRTGVVDADCRVHGMVNLHVAGASVFPTSGHANPTLMICALAFRLADHLSGQAAEARPVRPAA